MKSKQTAQERRKQIRQSQKVYGIPILPNKIDAMYENQCRGNLIAYYLDADPVREDSVYLKLEDLGKSNSLRLRDSEKVARNFICDMRARQMNENVYNHVRKIPSWILRFEFTIRYKTNSKLRTEIENRKNYMFRQENKAWID